MLYLGKLLSYVIYDENNEKCSRTSIFILTIDIIIIINNIFEKYQNENIYCSKEKNNRLKNLLIMLVTLKNKTL